MESFRMNLLSRALVVLIALSPLACSAAEAPKYKLGEHYLRVRAVQAPADPSKIEVMEVFAYSCPHCFKFEPELSAWLKKKPGDVAFVRAPHTLGNPAGAVRNKAFFAAQTLGVVDKFHPALFAAIHAEGKAMATPEEVRALFVKSTGVKGEEFDGVFSGFAADAGFRRGEQAIQAMGITSVPMLVVNGEYMVSPSAGGGFAGMLAIADFLIEQARRERAKR
jgi:protein dithiol oxidoreductase (disulfide-forming)